MKKQTVLSMLILSTVMLFVASASVNNTGHAADYKVALIVSKKDRGNPDINKLNINNRGYAAESDNNTISDQYNAEDYYNLGLTHDEAGRHNKAIEAYLQAIHARPEYAAAHYRIALAYLRSHDSIAAHDEYKELKKINPQMAKDLYEQAIELTLSDDDSHYVMQVGAYRNIEYAHEMIEKLRGEYLNAYIEQGKKFNVVRILGIKTMDEAAIIMKDINKKFKVDPFVLPVQ